MRLRELFRKTEGAPPVEEERQAGPHLADPTRPRFLVYQELGDNWVFKQSGDLSYMMRDMAMPAHATDARAALDAVRYKDSGRYRVIDFDTGAITDFEVEQPPKPDAVVTREREVVPMQPVTISTPDRGVVSHPGIHDND